MSCAREAIRRAWRILRGTSQRSAEADAIAAVRHAEHQIAMLAVQTRLHAIDRQAQWIEREGERAQTAAAELMARLREDL